MGHCSRVGAGADSATECNPPNASADQRTDILWRNTADGQVGQSVPSEILFEVGWADDDVFLLCGGIEHGANAAVICAVAQGLMSLVHAGGADAHEQAMLEESAHLGTWQIGLTKVYATRVSEQCDIGSVVDDDIDISRAAECDKFLGAVEQVAAVHLFFA